MERCRASWLYSQVYLLYSIVILSYEKLRRAITRLPVRPPREIHGGFLAHFLFLFLSFLPFLSLFFSHFFPPLVCSFASHILTFFSIPFLFKFIGKLLRASAPSPPVTYARSFSLPVRRVRSFSLPFPPLVFHKFWILFSPLRRSAASCLYPHALYERRSERVPLLPSIPRFVSRDDIARFKRAIK